VGFDEIIKILEIIVPCYLCTQCEAMQRKLRSMFYTITTDRRNGQLNAALRRLNLQLSQEKCQFSAGGLVEITTEMLGKVSRNISCIKNVYPFVYYTVHFWNDQLHSGLHTI